MPMPSCITFFSDELTTSCSKASKKMQPLSAIIGGFTLFMGSAFMPQDSWVSATLTYAIMCFALLIMLAGVNDCLRRDRTDRQNDAAYAVVNQL